MVPSEKPLLFPPSRRSPGFRLDIPRTKMRPFPGNPHKPQRVLFFLMFLRSFLFSHLPSPHGVFGQVFSLWLNKPRVGHDPIVLWELTLSLFFLTVLRCFAAPSFFPPCVALPVAWCPGFTKFLLSSPGLSFPAGQWPFSYTPRTVVPSPSRPLFLLQASFRDPSSSPRVFA